MLLSPLQIRIIKAADTQRRLKRVEFALTLFAPTGDMTSGKMPAQFFHSIGVADTFPKNVENFAIHADCSIA